MSSVALVAADMTVNAVSLAMIALGTAVFVLTMRFWRSAGEDPAVLAPLEVMGDRSFARAGEDKRVELLNSVRPVDADHPGHIEAPPVLDHEPQEQVRPFRDTFDHSDDAVDVVAPTAAVPSVIDPLLSRSRQDDDGAR
ncbi:MAG: hypothetical protein RL383_425 [Actinomycetota bacterium]|jgi:hypothetical protein